MKVFCDDCLTAAYDEVGEDPDAEYELLASVSYMLGDHDCEHVEDNTVRCDCEAHR